MHGDLSPPLACHDHLATFGGQKIVIIDGVGNLVVTAACP